MKVYPIDKRSLDSYEWNGDSAEFRVKGNPSVYLPLNAVIESISFPDERWISREKSDRYAVTMIRQGFGAFVPKTEGEKKQRSITFRHGVYRSTIGPLIPSENLKNKADGGYVIGRFPGVNPTENVVLWRMENTQNDTIDNPLALMLDTPKGHFMDEIPDDSFIPPSRKKTKIRPTVREGEATSRKNWLALSGILAATAVVVVVAIKNR